MTEAETTALLTIVRAEQAWSVWSEIDRGSGVLDTLEVSGYVARWERSDYLAVTLTPWAAEMLGVEIREHWEISSSEVPDPDDRRVKLRMTVAEEIPAWRDEALPLGRATRPPRYAREIALRHPERVVDPRATQYLCDEDGEPVRLFGGHTITIDRRLGA